MVLTELREGRESALQKPFGGCVVARIARGLAFVVIAESGAETKIAGFSEELASGCDGLAREVGLAGLKERVSFQKRRFGLDGLARCWGRRTGLRNSQRQRRTFREKEIGKQPCAAGILGNKRERLLRRIQERESAVGLSVQRAERCGKLVGAGSRCFQDELGGLFGRLRETIDVLHGDARIGSHEGERAAHGLTRQVGHDLALENRVEDVVPLHGLSLASPARMRPHSVRRKARIGAVLEETGTVAARAAISPEFARVSGRLAVAGSGGAMLRLSRACRMLLH